MKSKKLTTMDLCYIGIFTAIIAILAQVSIPMPYGVPLTLQTFAIMLAGVVLGGRKAAWATVIYLLVGAVGVPVFAGFKGGMSSILGPTGGFLLSFPIVAYIVGIAAEKSSRKWLAIGLFTACIINYLCGIFVFSLVTSNGLKVAFMACVLPFIPLDIVKAILSGVIGVKSKQNLKKIKVFT